MTPQHCNWLGPAFHQDFLCSAWQNLWDSLLDYVKVWRGGSSFSGQSHHFAPPFRTTENNWRQLTLTNSQFLRHWKIINQYKAPFILYDFHGFHSSHAVISPIGFLYSSIKGDHPCKAKTWAVGQCKHLLPQSQLSPMENDCNDQSCQILVMAVPFLYWIQQSLVLHPWFSHNTQFEWENIETCLMAFTLNFVLNGSL